MNLPDEVLNGIIPDSKIANVISLDFLKDHIKKILEERFKSENVVVYKCSKCGNVELVQVDNKSSDNEVSNDNLEEIEPKKKVVKKKWTEKEVEILKKSIDFKKTTGQIAKVLDRTPQAIYMKLSGYPELYEKYSSYAPKGFPTKKKTYDEEEFIRYVNEGKSTYEIQQNFGLKKNKISTMKWKLKKEGKIV